MTIDTLFGSRIAEVVPDAITPALAAELRARVAHYTRYALLDRGSYEHAVIDEPALFTRLVGIVEKRLALAGGAAMGASAMGAGAMGAGSSAMGVGAMGAGAMDAGSSAMGVGAMGAGAMGAGSSAMGAASSASGAGPSAMGPGSSAGTGSSAGAGSMGVRSVVEARVLRFSPGDYLLAHADRVYEGNPIEIVLDLSDGVTPGAEVHYRRRGAVFFRVPSAPCSLAIVERGPTVTCNHTYVSKRHAGSVVRLVALVR
jgi:hypothetical protein